MEHDFILRQQEETKGVKYRTETNTQMMEDTQKRTGDKAGHHKGRTMIGDKLIGSTLRETPDERQVKAKKRHPKSRTTPFRQGVQWPESRTTPARLGDKWIAESRKPGRQMNLGDMRKARRHKPERETNELGDIQSAGHHDSDRDNKWIGRLGDKWIGWWINLKRWPSSAQPLREPLMCMYIFVCMYTYVHLYIYMCVHTPLQVVWFWEWCAIGLPH